MALVDIRHRTGYLLLGVVLGHIILISAQVNVRGGVPLFEVVTFGVFAEIQRGAWTVFSGSRELWNEYVNLRQVRAENRELGRRLNEVQMALQQERARADRSRGLEQLLQLRDRTRLSTIATEVIASGATPDFRTFTLDKGTEEGIEPDMAVIAPVGVVGRVIVPSAHAAKVQLLIDRNAAAGALITRSRAQGVVVGGGDNRLHLRYLSETADVAVGDEVVTSGIDGIYPKGFVIGRVTSAEKTGTTFRDVIVRPAVDFTRLEEALVVVPSPSPPVAAGEEAKR